MKFCFLKMFRPSQRVLCFILNNLHFPMVEGIAFYALYKLRVLIIPWNCYQMKFKKVALYLLTYLIGHNKPINGFRPAATHPSRRFGSLRAYACLLHQSMIWSFQRLQGRPLRRLSQIPASNTRLAGASSSIQTTWPSQSSRWILIRCTMSMSLRSSYRAHY